jgi:hypothetical protein
MTVATKSSENLLKSYSSKEHHFPEDRNISLFLV